MDRRSFLKNSLFALFSTAVSSNKVLATVADTLPSTSTNVLLYLIQNKKGYWFVRGTKWVDVVKTKINETKYNLDTFKPLEIVPNEIAEQTRLKLWKEHNCGGGPGGGTGFPIDVEKSTKAWRNGFESEAMKKYFGSELKKLNSSIHGKNLAKLGIPQKNGLKVLDLPIEKKLEFQRKSALARIGRKASDEHKSNISKGLKGKPKSEEHRLKLSLAKKGKKMDEETKKKISLTISGKGNPMFGKTHSLDTRKKMSQNNKSYHIIRTCEHCKREIKGPNFYRHHGDNCKLKNP